MTDNGGERELLLDLSPNDWKMGEQMAYRDKVGVNAQYALLKIGEAFTAEPAEEGEPPAEVFNIPPAYLIGYVWIAQRRQEPGLKFSEVVDAVDYSGLLEAFVDAVGDTVEEEPDAPGPLASPAKKPSSRPSKAASPRAKSSAGRSKTSKT